MWTRLLVAALVGCGGGAVDGPLVGDAQPADCSADEGGYPPGAVEPMTLGEVLSPYRWPRAIRRSDAFETALDLADVPCATDPEIDWSRTAALLFVSIPAW